MAVSPKQAVVVFFTVWLSILHVKHIASDWLVTGGAYKTVHMPGLFEGIHDFPQDFLLAAGTGGSKKLLVAIFTVNLALLLYEAAVRQGGMAVRTVEFLRVPGHAHGHKERAPDDIVAFAAHGRACASWDVLSPLHQRVQVLRVRLRSGAVCTFGSRATDLAK